MAWLIVLIMGAGEGIGAISKRSWIFLILSGLATGASWLCYFYALKIGKVSDVVAVDKFSLALGIILAVVILGEALTAKTAIGAVLITIGTFVLIL